MPKWMQTSEEIPEEVEVGDRIVIIVNERPYAGAAIRRRLVILEATEDGWDSPDDTFAGYTPQNGLLWATEKSICEIATVVVDSADDSDGRNYSHGRCEQCGCEVHPSCRICGECACGL